MQGLARQCGVSPKTIRRALDAAGARALPDAPLLPGTVGAVAGPFAADWAYSVRVTAPLAFYQAALQQRVLPLPGKAPARPGARRTAPTPTGSPG
ncbi:hypothetical protein AB0H18_05435 [Streptomyces sp. NPDC020766]|uniref:hypothetical protein n=1 Tax=Streptomyces sp. NPDC020766 TaxID=3155011 RepID=UPI0033C337E8